MTPTLIHVTDAFTTQENLLETLGASYTRQAVRQWYRLLGSADILGNPLGLIDSLGGGVIEFFRAPAQGLLSDGLMGLGLGVQQGTQALVLGAVQLRVGRVVPAPHAALAVVGATRGARLCARARAGARASPSAHGPHVPLARSFSHSQVHGTFDSVSRITGAACKVLESLTLPLTLTPTITLPPTLTLTITLTPKPDLNHHRLGVQGARERRRRRHHLPQPRRPRDRRGWRQRRWRQ